MGGRTPDLCLCYLHRRDDRVSILHSRTVSGRSNAPGLGPTGRCDVEKNHLAIRLNLTFDQWKHALRVFGPIQWNKSSSIHDSPPQHDKKAATLPRQWQDVRGLASHSGLPVSTPSPSGTRQHCQPTVHSTRVGSTQNPCSCHAHWQPTRSDKVYQLRGFVNAILLHATRFRNRQSCNGYHKYSLPFSAYGERDRSFPSGVTDPANDTKGRRNPLFPAALISGPAPPHANPTVSLRNTYVRSMLGQVAEGGALPSGWGQPCAHP